jgi:hypothetical protein
MRLKEKGLPHDFFLATGVGVESDWKLAPNSHCPVVVFGLSTSLKQTHHSEMSSKNLSESVSKMSRVKGFIACYPVKQTRHYSNSISLFNKRN